jgi:hypothetical protein
MVMIAQTGSSVIATSSTQSWSPAVGTVSVNTISMFGMIGTISHGRISWASGESWSLDATVAGSYLDSDGAEVRIAQAGEIVVVTSNARSWSPAVGTVSVDTISMLGLTGTMSNGQIAWDNGESWLLQVNVAGTYLDSIGGEVKITQTGNNVFATSSTSRWRRAARGTVSGRAISLLGLTGILSKGRISWTGGEEAWSLEANFAGSYIDSNGGAISIVQTGDNVVVTSSTHGWSPAVGTVSVNTISMLGLTGALSNGQVSWTNGETWSLDASVTGSYLDSMGREVMITQTGNNVFATSSTQSWSPAVGTVIINIISMLNMTGTLLNGLISWTNGETWSLKATVAGSCLDSIGSLVVVTQTGDHVVATSATHGWSPAVGTVSVDTISMLGLTGTLSNGQISWTNGDTWSYGYEFYFGTALPGVAAPHAVLDEGRGFGRNMIGGLRYGWDCDGNANVDYSSGRRNTSRGGGLGLNRFDRWNTCGSTDLSVNWQLELPNGEYSVAVIFDEGSKQSCKIQGMNANCGSSHERCEVKKDVRVDNGTFTITGYSHASSNHQCHSVSKVKMAPKQASFTPTFLPTAKSVPTATPTTVPASVPTIAPTGGHEVDSETAFPSSATTTTNTTTFRFPTSAPTIIPTDGHELHIGTALPSSAPTPPAIVRWTVVATASMVNDNDWIANMVNDSDSMGRRLRLDSSRIGTTTMKNVDIKSSSPFRYWKLMWTGNIASHCPLAGWFKIVPADAAPAVVPVPAKLKYLEYDAFEVFGPEQSQRADRDWFVSNASNGNNQTAFSTGINFNSTGHGIVMQDTIARSFKNLEWYSTYNELRACNVEIFGSNVALGISDEWTEPPATVLQDASKHPDPIVDIILTVACIVRTNIVFYCIVCASLSIVCVCICCKLNCTVCLASAVGCLCLATISTWWVVLAGVGLLVHDGECPTVFGQWTVAFILILCTAVPLAIPSCCCIGCVLHKRRHTAASQEVDVETQYNIYTKLSKPQLGVGPSLAELQPIPDLSVSPGEQRSCNRPPLLVRMATPEWPSEARQAPNRSDRSPSRLSVNRPPDWPSEFSMVVKVQSGPPEWPSQRVWLSSGSDERKEPEGITSAMRNREGSPTTIYERKEVTREGKCKISLMGPEHYRDIKVAMEHDLEVGASLAELQPIPDSVVSPGDQHSCNRPPVLVKMKSGHPDGKTSPLVYSGLTESPAEALPLSNRSDEHTESYCSSAVGHDEGAPGTMKRRFRAMAQKDHKTSLRGLRSTEATTNRIDARGRITKPKTRAKTFVGASATNQAHNEETMTKKRNHGTTKPHWGNNANHSAALQTQALRTVTKHPSPRCTVNGLRSHADSHFDTGHVDVDVDSLETGARSPTKVGKSKELPDRTDQGLDVEHIDVHVCSFQNQRARRDQSTSSSDSVCTPTTIHEREEVTREGKYTRSPLVAGCSRDADVAMEPDLEVGASLAELQPIPDSVVSPGEQRSCNRPPVLVKMVSDPSECRSEAPQLSNGSDDPSESQESDSALGTTSFGKGARQMNRRARALTDAKKSNLVNSGPAEWPSKAIPLINREGAPATIKRGYRATAKKDHLTSSLALRCSEATIMRNDARGRLTKPKTRAKTLEPASATQQAQITTDGATIRRGITKGHPDHTDEDSDVEHIDVHVCSFQNQRARRIQQTSSSDSVCTRV